MSSENSPTSNEVRKLRRNGKLQSCEPCRKSKIRCDHETPVCGRCRAKNRGSSCVYHPAPLTRPRNQLHRWHVETFTPPQSASTSVRPTAILTPEDDERQAEPQQVAAQHTPTSPVEDSSKPKPQFNLGYLGSTSFSAVFDDSKRDGGTLPALQTLAPMRNLHMPDTKSDELVLDVDRIRAGAKLLKMLPEISSLVWLIERYYRLAHFIIISSRILRQFLESIRPLEDTHLRTETGRNELSARILKNTMRPYRIHRSMTPDEFHGLFTGENLRWEFIGIVFALVGLSSLTMTKQDSQDVHLIEGITEAQASKYPSTEEMTLASNACIELTDYCEAVSDPLIWLLYKNKILLTMYEGDSSHAAWRRGGHVADAVYALGLHQDNTLRENAPFFLIELRRRTFAAAYNLDKSMSTFLGRPPRIQGHYSVVYQPLDLSDEQITLEGEDLDAAIRRLDSQGWNCDRMIHMATWLRVRFKLAQIREDVLHLSLGKIPEDLSDQVRLITEKCEATWASIPEFMRYHEGIWNTALDASRCYMLMVLHFDYLYSHFLLRRVLAKHMPSANEPLLDISRKLLSTVLILSTERIRLRDIARDFSWLILFYGLPAAAVLSIELLRNHHRPADGPTTLPNRGEVIRNLSVFISCLEWVSRRPDGSPEGNHEACQDALRVLTRILDAVLEPPKGAFSDVGMENGLPEDPGSWMGDLLQDGAGAAGPFLEGLDTIDWDMSNWTLAL